MGEKDITQKTLLAYNDVFADILNALLFDGEQVVTVDELRDAQTFSQYKVSDGDIHGQERDVAKYWKKGILCLSLFGLENQTERDRIMPLRVMGYDGASYRGQLKNKKLYPVITLVLYFGTEYKWNKPKSLKDSLEIDKRLLPFFHDYGMNVFDIAWLTDKQINSFKSDFKLVPEFLRAVRVGEAEQWQSQKIKYVEEICDLLKAVSNDDIFDSMKDFIIESQKKTGGFQMSEFVSNMINRGRSEGISIGRSEGISIGRSEGISIGRSEGISSMSTVLAKLYSEGRAADVQRAVTDRAYLMQLLSEHNENL